MLIAVLLLTASCAASGAETYQKYRYTFFGCFDTVIIFTAYARDQGEFETYAKLVESEMMRYHRIFDKNTKKSKNWPAKSREMISL